jgi:integrase/recombinase XerD
VVPLDDGTLFLTATGEELSPNRLTQLVREYVNAADTGKKGACHWFRHTMATVMLENGADIRYIQEMLGHVELSTTQIYTQVSIKKLQAVHALTHPTARLERQESAIVESRPEVEGPAIAKVTANLDELSSRLGRWRRTAASAALRTARLCSSGRHWLGDDRETRRRRSTRR